MGHEERSLTRHFQERTRRAYRKEARAREQLRRQSEEGERGIVVSAGRGTCRVLTGDSERECVSIPGTAAGDSVVLSANGRRVAALLPRATVLSRPDPANPHHQRVIAANVEVAVHVVSVVAPPLSTGLIDRFLAAISRGGAQPVIAVNKVDLDGAAGELARLAPYRALGVPVVECSARTGAGLGDLAALLAGRLCAFAGHSGAGKSSLLNALDPSLGLATGEVSEDSLKGRHTTTASRMYRLPNGARVIDTPGIREFGLWAIGPGELRAYFPEFEALRCRFRDCSHVHEPDCAVRAAVEQGTVPAARYQAYRRILETVRRE